MGAEMVTPPRSLTVAIASRDRVYRESLALPLQRRGLRVRPLELDGDVFGTGLEGVDVLVIDSDGLRPADLERINRLHVHCPLVEVVAVTGDLTVEEAVDALRAGVFTVLQHPVADEHLVATIAQAGQRHQRARARLEELNHARYAPLQDGGWAPFARGAGEAICSMNATAIETGTGSQAGSAATGPRSTNIFEVQLKVTRQRRERALDQRGVTVWLTGLSASGKSTVALLVDRMLTDRGKHCSVLDGDIIRFGLNRDLGFGPEDRSENIRRIGEVAKLFTQAGIINLVAVISPYIADRDRNRQIQEPRDFVEVFLDCPLAVCEQRDPRGLYAKARMGQISEFTGISAPYEPPSRPEIVLMTAAETEAESALRVVRYLERYGYLKRD